MTWQSAGRAIWRYRWLAAMLTAILVLATGLLVGRQTPTYETSAKVRIIQKVAAGDVPALDTAAQNAASYSLLIGGNEFAKLVQVEVAATLPGISEGEINGAVFAVPVPGTDILSIFATGTNPERIAVLANAAFPALQKLATTQGDSERVLPVDSANIPDAPVSPRVRLAIAVALILGLVINGSLMVLLDLLRDRYADSEELQEATGRPVLATVPRFTEENFLHADRPESAEAEQEPGPELIDWDIEPNGRETSADLPPDADPDTPSPRPRTARETTRRRRP